MGRRLTSTGWPSSKAAAWFATAKRYRLDALVDRRPVKVIGIGAVFTPESRRGRGHAADLLRRMLQSAADEGFGLALLFSEIDSPVLRTPRLP